MADRAWLDFSCYVNRSWRCFRWAVILAVIGFVAVAQYLVYRGDEEIRRFAEARLASHYEHLSVSVRSAHRLADEGIQIRGISISDAVTGAQLLDVEELFLECPAAWSELLAGRIASRRIVLRRPTLYAVTSGDNRWSAAALWPPPQFSSSPPQIDIENATVVVRDTSHRDPSDLVLRDINLKVRPTTTDDESHTEINHIEGSFAGDHMRRVELRGWATPDADAWHFTGGVEDLALSPSLLKSLPGTSASNLAALEALRSAKAAMQFTVAHTRGGQAIDFNVTGQLSEGRVQHPALPFPVGNVAGRFTLDNSGVRLEQVTARAGETVLRLGCVREGYAADSPLWVSLECDNLHVDRSLIPDEIPAFAPLAELYDRYSPEGRVDVTSATLRFDGERWHPERLFVQCENISFAYQKFPYRLERGSGSFQLVDGRLDLHLKAHGTHGLFQIDGVAEPVGPTAGMNFTIRGDRVPLDESLMRALQPKQRELLGDFHAQGSVGVNLQITRPAGSGDHPHVRMNVAVANCTMRHERFPYPITNVGGWIVVDGPQWRFVQFSGENDQGRIFCNGSFGPDGEGHHELELAFTGENITLENELRDALPAERRAIWDDIEPRGAVNLIRSEVHYSTATQRTTIEADVVPFGNTVSILPRQFPYRLENLSGMLKLRDGLVEIVRVRGVHGQARVSLAGTSTVDPTGRWELALSSLNIEGIHADDTDLQAAMPDGLRTAVRALGPRGDVQVSGALSISGSSDSATPATSAWNLNIDMHEGMLNCSVPLEHIQGGVRVSGRFDGRKVQASGIVDVDSLIYKNVQLTSVLGPLTIDGSNVYLGTLYLNHAVGQPINSLHADVSGGKIRGDAVISLGEQPRFELSAALYQPADLKRISREVFTGREQLTGNLLGDVRLSGGKGVHTLSGAGHLSLRDADIYELPVMVSLLSVLSLKAPDATAFRKSDIDFRLVGDIVYFDRIDFNGDAISLLGKGEMSFDQRLHLAFYAFVGRDDWKVPVIRDLASWGSQNLMLVHVDGTVSNPLPRQEPLPGVQRLIEQLGDLVPGDDRLPLDPDTLTPNLTPRAASRSVKTTALPPPPTAAPNHTPLR
ncbi:MAG: AsmA-like C-terminal region-containing protein [Pirellulales bacterium]